VLSRSLAWFFIVLAACPYTAPFSVCDLSQSVAGTHAYAVTPGIAATTSQVVPASRLKEELLKDDEDQMKDTDVATTPVIESARSIIVVSTPSIRQSQSPRPPLVALRL
jgi:hypothetical protein